MSLDPGASLSDLQQAVSTRQRATEVGELTAAIDDVVRNDDIVSLFVIARGSALGRLAGRVRWRARLCFDDVTHVFNGWTATAGP